MLQKKKRMIAHRPQEVEAGVTASPLEEELSSLPPFSTLETHTDPPRLAQLSHMHSPQSRAGDGGATWVSVPAAGRDTVLEQKGLPGRDRGPALPPACFKRHVPLSLWLLIPIRQKGGVREISLCPLKSVSERLNTSRTSVRTLGHGHLSSGLGSGLESGSGSGSGSDRGHSRKG